MARRQLYVFGCAGDGQLGFRPDSVESDAQMMIVPRLVYGAPTRQNGVIVKSIASGERHTLFLSDDGKVWSCGSNYNGELGRGGVREGSYTIYPVHISSTVSIIQISAGRSHSMAVSDDGRLFAWGSNSHGQLAMSGDILASDTPKRVPSLPETVQVACGASHTVSLNGGGRVFIWGQQSDGRIRHSPAEVEIFISIPIVQNVVNPCAVPNINSVVAVECGDSHSIALTHEGRVFSCGSDSFGQLGCGQPNRCHTIVVANGKMHTFGLNSNGQLGHGNTRNQITPRVIDSVENVASVFAGWDQSFCLQIHTKHAYDVLSGPSSYLQKPKYLSLQRIRDLFAVGDKLTIIGSVYLEKWWSLLERRHFNRLVLALVKALEQLVEHEPNNTSNVVPFCSILSRLNAINRSQKLIAYDKFYLNNLQKKVDMANDLAGWEFNAQHDVFYWSNYPFLLNADLKTYLLQLEAHIQMQISMSTSGIMILPFNISLQPHPFFEISVHRDNIVDDAMIALLSSKHMDLKKPLKVYFIGEEADDAGGVKKEFFMLLFQELLQAKYGMFTENEESHLIWFSGVETDPLSFKLVGMLCALAIYNSVLVDFPFPLALYKKILDVPLELEDLSELSPAEGRSLRSLLDYEDDDIEEVFSLKFMISVSLLGDSKDIELKTNGAEIPVNQANKLEFVQLYIKKRLEEGCYGEIGRQMRSFAEGFGSVMHSKIMNFFQPQELMEMVVGNENYDWNLFRKNAEYKGVYHARHEAILCFWEVFFEFNIVERKKFLQFLMGTTRIPIQGMSAVQIRIQPCDEKALPVAHTCFNLLDLPNITDRQEMRRRLLICLDQCHGFNLV
uniref:Bm8133 n=1 Tax=Brugia malayi TaxID=6279 RepID=A0A1I9GCG9_BRUMA|nr:Bm8133 [Brugia malayi]